MPTPVHLAFPSRGALLSPCTVCGTGVHLRAKLDSVQQALDNKTAELDRMMGDMTITKEEEDKLRKEATAALKAALKVVQPHKVLD